MVDPIIGGVLNWLHVISGIGWLGAAMLFGMVLGPLLPEMAPSARKELIVKFFPKLATYVSILAGSTLVFGLALAGAMVGNGSLAMTSQWGIEIMIGGVLALAAAAVAMGVVIPSMKKVVRLLSGGDVAAGPDPEVAKLMGRMRVGASVGLVLLFLVVVFMVAAAWAP